MHDIGKRDEVIGLINGAKEKRLVATGWLGEGETAIVCAGARFMVVHSPAGTRCDGDDARLLFYAADGVLAHEEVAHGSLEEWARDNLRSMGSESAKAALSEIISQESVTVVLLALADVLEADYPEESALVAKAANL